jgi:DNA-binding HxlR family transcriptional regulator
MIMLDKFQPQQSRDVTSLTKGFIVLGDYTTLRILYQLDRYGEQNFTQLKESLHINPATLSKKLRLLMEVAIVSSDRTHDNLRVYYSIAHHQRSLKKFLDSFERFAQEL